jgi:hypothetical protein
MKELKVGMCYENQLGTVSLILRSAKDSDYQRGEQDSLILPGMGEVILTGMGAGVIEPTSHVMEYTERPDLASMALEYIISNIDLGGYFHIDEVAKVLKTGSE